MSDEIKKAQEMAKEHGIYEIVRNIASNGKNTGGTAACDSTWEECVVVFECPNGAPLPKVSKEVRAFSSAFSSALNEVAANRTSSATTKVLETRITMADGTILYRVLEKGQEVTDFRYGAWVERIKKYSDQIMLEKQQAAEEKAKKKQEVALKPFTKIDF